VAAPDPSQALRSGELRAQELRAIVQAVQEKVRSQYPAGHSGGVPLADLMPVVHARDAAEGKVAGIGWVNPRRGGLLNGAVQAAKRLIARSLGWFVREQVEFNRLSIQCVNALIEALNESNRAAAHLSARIAALEARKPEGIEALRQELDDIRHHWSQWRPGWEARLSESEVRLLRGVADLQLAFQHRATVTETQMREAMASERRAFEALTAKFSGDFNAAMTQAAEAVQDNMWRGMDELRADVEKARLDMERSIHAELRLLRQRSQITASTPAAPIPAAQPELPIDWLRFAEKFRGSREYVRGNCRRYIERFRGAGPVLDLGCGRGEFLELAREAGIPARGIDLSAENIALCHSLGLDAECADLFPYLEALAPASLGGIFCSQVVEHLAPAELIRLVRLCAEKLDRGGVLVIETPNPECLAIFATHFFLDPTHVRPVPPALLAFYVEEAGLGSIDVERSNAAVESMPSLGALPEEFRNAFFGGLDYALSARKLL